MERLTVCVCVCVCVWVGVCVCVWVGVGGCVCVCANLSSWEGFDELVWDCGHTNKLWNPVLTVNCEN